MERIGAHDVVGRLAEGRMGTVWLARSRGGRQLAVRVVRAELAADPAFRERFRAEAAALRTVGGLHTVPVVDADPDAAAPWLATAYVPGPTLARILAGEGPLAEKRLRGLGTALAEALQEIHRCGLVHGDLKPGAVVMAADGPRVLDFSLARTLRDPRLPGGGPPFGTPGFLAPEQAAGLEPGPAADVFALGAVLVAAAGGGTLGSVQQGADLAAVPASLRPVVAACLDHDPARRPTTDQLLDRLSPFPAAPVPGPAPVPGYAQAVTIPPGPPVPAMPPQPPAPPALPPSPYAPGAPLPPMGAGAAPEFLAMDRRNAVVLDAEGMSIGSDGAIVTFPWPAVDVAWCEKGPGRGNVLLVALALHDGTVHSCEVTTRDPAELAAWMGQFTATLAYWSPEE